MKFSIGRLESNLKTAKEHLEDLKKYESQLTEALGENASAIVDVKDQIENLETAIDLLKKHEVK